jgi:hypothetical protein
MNALESVAGDVAGKIGEHPLVPKTYKIDPAIIQMLIELLREILPALLDNCQKTPDQIRQDCEEILHPSRVIGRLHAMMNRRWLQRKVKSVFGSAVYREMGGVVEDSVCAVGVGVTDEALYACYREC